MKRLIDWFKNIFNPLSGRMAYIDENGKMIIWKMSARQPAKDGAYDPNTMGDDVRLFCLDHGCNGWNVYHAMREESRDLVGLVSAHSMYIDLRNFEGLTRGIPCKK
ncbi:hypothetical protein VPHK469_0049 [Vibrio phage K469]